MAIGYVLQARGTADMIAEKLRIAAKNQRADALDSVALIGFAQMRAMVLGIRRNGGECLLTTGLAQAI
jgi:hypothetical protein